MLTEVAPNHHSVLTVSARWCPSEQNRSEWVTLSLDSLWLTLRCAGSGKVNIRKTNIYHIYICIATYNIYIYIIIIIFK